MSEKYDVVIIGAGPGGLSAALWCGDLGLSAAVFETKEEIGGQLLWIHDRVSNYPGLACDNGKDLRDKFVASLANPGSLVFTESAVVSVDLRHRKVSLADGRSVSCSSLILATGVRRRELGIPGESEFRSRGVLASGVGEKHTLAGKSVVVVGGGDAALENTILLSEIAAQVTLIHRRNFSARKEFMEGVQHPPNVRIITDARVLSIHGGSQVESVTAEHINIGSTERIDAQAVLIRIGVIPNTELVAGSLELDQKGYVAVDALGMSSVPGVYAIGDVANPTAPTIAGAVGTAATVVKTIAAQLQRA